MAQWLRLGAPNARDLVSIPGQGTRCHMQQLRAHMPQTKGATCFNQDPKQPKEKRAYQKAKGSCMHSPGVPFTERPSDHIHPLPSWPCTPPLLHTKNGWVTIWLEFFNSETWSGLCLTNQLFEKKSTIYLACRPDGIFFPLGGLLMVKAVMSLLGCFHGGCQWRPMALYQNTSQCNSCVETKLGI